jgi:hypothetical protein
LLGVAVAVLLGAAVAVAVLLGVEVVLAVAVLLGVDEGVALAPTSRTAVTEAADGFSPLADRG